MLNPFFNKGLMHSSRGEAYVENSTIYSEGAVTFKKGLSVTSSHIYGSNVKVAGKMEVLTNESGFDSEISAITSGADNIGAVSLSNIDLETSLYINGRLNTKGKSLISFNGAVNKIGENNQLIYVSLYPIGRTSYFNDYLCQIEKNPKPMRLRENLVLATVKKASVDDFALIYNGESTALDYDQRGMGSRVPGFDLKKVKNSLVYARM